MRKRSGFPVVVAVLLGQCLAVTPAWAEEPAPPATEGAPQVVLPTAQAGQPPVGLFAPPPGAPGTVVTLRADSPRAAGVELRRVRTSRGSEVGRRGRTVSPAVETDRVVCSAPCGVLVDPAATYRVAAPGIPASLTFRLPPGPAVELNVHAGDLRLFTAGGWMGFSGGLLILAGGVMALVGDLEMTDPAGIPSYGPPLLITGAIAAGVGVALLAAGVPIAVRHSTSVRSGDGRKLAGLQLTPRGLVF